MYARALSPKIKILQANQAKIDIFCVEFQELSSATFACQLIVLGTGVFPRQMNIFGLVSKKNKRRKNKRRLVELTNGC